MSPALHTCCMSDHSKLSVSRGYTVLQHSEAMAIHNASQLQSILNLWALLLLSCRVWLHGCAFCTAGCSLSV